MGGVITVILLSIGQLASGMIDGQQLPGVASRSRANMWCIFSQGHTQDRLVFEVNRVVPLLDSCTIQGVCVCVCAST